jgi:long-subunit fatty acid transport protein
MLAVRHLSVAVATFVMVTVAALALGAANLGTAATFGQVAFVAVLVALITRPAGRS